MPKAGAAKEQSRARATKAAVLDKIPIALLLNIIPVHSMWVIVTEFW